MASFRYYASLITYHPVRELKRMNREVAHAYLLCFISYRYQKVNDNLVNTFLYHVSRFIDEAKKAAKEQIAEERLEGTIKRVNDRIRLGKNPDIKITGKGENLRWHLLYHNDEAKVDHPLYNQPPQIGVVKLIGYVDQLTNCFSVFRHTVDRYAKQCPDTKRLIACLTAFGLNIGFLKMAEISDMSYQEMISTAGNFVFLENLKNGNDIITNEMAKLPIFKYSNIEEEIIHGSIDGQKLDIK